MITRGWGRQCPQDNVDYPVLAQTVLSFAVTGASAVRCAQRHDATVPVPVQTATGAAPRCRVTLLDVVRIAATISAG